MNVFHVLFFWEIFYTALVNEQQYTEETEIKFSPVRLLHPKGILHYHAKWCLGMILCPSTIRQKYKLQPNHAKSLRRLLIVSGDIHLHPGPSFQCKDCKQEFKYKKNLTDHVRRVHDKTGVEECPEAGCNFKTAYRYNLKRHAASHEQSTASKSRKMSEPIQEKVSQVINNLLDKVVRKVNSVTAQTALNGSIRVVRIQGNGADPLLNLNDAVPQTEDEIKVELDKQTGVKAQLVMSVKFYKPLNPEETSTSHFRSYQIPIYRGSEIDIRQSFNKILNSINEYQKEGSGWAIEKIIQIELHLAKLQPLRGSTYSPLPPYLRNKKALINIQNTDEKCFIWSVLALLHKARHNPQRVSNYERYERTIRIDGIPLPMRIKDIDRFERLNYISINVYGYDEDDGIHPVRISKYSGRRWLHLLYYNEHYVAIKNLNKLLFDQTKRKCAKFFCYRCMQGKTSRELLQRHIKLCEKKEPVRTKMPEDNILKFSNVSRMLKQPLVLFGDFECTLSPCNDQVVAGVTVKEQVHKPCGYGLLTSNSCCGDPKFGEPIVHRSENAIFEFLEKVLEISEDHQKFLRHKKPIHGQNRTGADQCHICNTRIRGKPVKDHCHICGQFRGLAHNRCNREYRLSKDIVVVFHNLRKYDGHLLMQEIGSFAKNNNFEVDVIAKAMEDYLSFSLIHRKREGELRGYRIKFIDSVQFLNNSLDGLVKNLDPSKLFATRRCFSDDEKFKLVSRKGVYCYDFFDSFQKFDEPFPDRAAFYNKLNSENVSEADYIHAKNVYNKFGMNSMGDYHDLYLKTDVLLLADVFEEFRRFALEKYGLDPCHYVTLPALAWDACLKMTKVELELFQDPDMYIMCELGIRGGISMICHRHAVANIPETSNYNPQEPPSYIIYLDANNLYGWAMQQPLPQKDFKFLSQEELARLEETDWDLVDEAGDEGFILEVDLDYPQGLHEKHDMYPLAPEALSIDTISEYSQKIKDNLKLEVPTQKKLVPNLYNKRKYIVHFRTLKFYLQKGMLLKKIWRGIKFTQQAWLSPYINFNSRMRSQATNAFDKDLFKLLNNAVFVKSTSGKTMENVRKYRVVKLVYDEEQFVKLVANPRYTGSCIFNEDLVGVSMFKASTSLCKPIYCGVTVLDLSKELMYRFHYDYITPKYNVTQRRAQLLFTDTDSLCYHIQTENVYKDLGEDSDRFDFSDYPSDHELYSVINKKKVGLFKDELNGTPIQRWCGLRPKMYAMLPEKKRAKGIKRKVVEKNISYFDYEYTLLNETSMRHRMTVLRSEKHEIYTETINKRSLCSYDDKRWLLNAIESRARGHFMNM